MNKLDFVDTHFHLWDLNDPNLYYEIFEEDYGHPVIGDAWDRLKGSNYLIENFLSDISNSNVIKAIHVQAAIGISDPVNESAWLQGLADRTGFPNAIVAYSNLKDPNVEKELERHLEHPNVKGIRDFSDGDYLIDPIFHRGYALLEKFNLIASVDVAWENMGKLKNLAKKYPNISCVLDHCGFPTSRTDDYFQNWKNELSTLAEAENIICKISGLGMADQQWTTDSIRPWVLSCIEAFGPDRCVFATNWPVDKLFSDYNTVINAYTEIISEFSKSEQIAMFSANAEKLYRI
tara:strand:+ start:1224 stop:2096 length:873 start_codon:yes stop_codon:yes gene_type:complete